MRLEQWLACFHSNLSARQASEVFQTPNKRWRLPDRLKQYIQNPRRSKLHEDIQRDLEWAAAAGNHLIAYDNECYPPLLKKIQDAPCILFVLGQPEALKFPSIAVVGPRKASSEGIYNARIFTSALVSRGFSIVSGLAEGIDGVAHKTTLVNGGRTTAIIGTGVDVIYPRIHTALTQKIIDSEQGAIVSIFRRGAQPLAGNFPQRNRIISGMSLTTLVIEAGLRSGAMITARLACEQGRDVFAIPGSIHAPLSKGSNKLIKDGALLMESVDDLMEQVSAIYAGYAQALNHPVGDQKEVKGKKDRDARPSRQDSIHSAKQVPAAERKSQTPSAQIQHIDSASLSDPAHQLLKRLNYHPAHPDELMQQDKLHPNQIDSALTELELLGLISLEDGLYRRTPVQIKPNSHPSK